MIDFCANYWVQAALLGFGCMVLAFVFACGNMFGTFRSINKSFDNMEDFRTMQNKMVRRSMRTVVTTGFFGLIGTIGFVIGLIGLIVTLLDRYAG